MKARFAAVAAASSLAFAVGGATPHAANTLPTAIAFAKAEADGGGVFVWERTGRVRLLAGGAHSPAWSPDGRRLAYVRDSLLWVADADGSHRAQLADDATSADWGADGRSLVVDRAGTLVVVQADGARERVLTTGAEPAWSSRNRIAFVRGGDLYRVEPSGRGLRQLTASTAIESAPAWSPDGRRLAFVATEGVTVDLYVLDIVGGDSHS